MKPPPPCTYRGKVKGYPDSIAALSLTAAGWSGRVELDGKSRFFLQPVDSRSKAEGVADHWWGNEADLPSHDIECGWDERPDLNPSAPEADYAEGFDESVSKGAASFQVAEIAIDADYPYFQYFGADRTMVMQEVETILNMVSAMFERDVLVGYELTELIIRTSSTADPYTSTTDPIALLQEFNSHWVTNHTAVPRDIAQLFSGRSFNGNTKGVAFRGVICNQFNGSSIAQGTFDTNVVRRAVVSAHELGHNWNCRHCNMAEIQPGEPNPNYYPVCCSDPLNGGGSYNMCSDTGFNLLERFCPPSIAVILLHKSSRTCLETGILPATPTATQTQLASVTETPTPSHTQAATWTQTGTPTRTTSPTPSVTATVADPTPTRTGTLTPTETKLETATATATLTQGAVVPGDLDGDQNIDHRDAFQFSRFFGGEGTGEAIPADLVEDGSVNAVDLLKFVLYRQGKAQ